MNTLESAEELFDSISEKYDSWFKKDPAYMSLIGFIAQRAAELKPKRILDVGIGTGNLAEAILKKHRPQKYAGIDCAGEMIEESRKKFSKFGFVELEKKSIQELDAEKEFDCIATNYVLHHLTHNEKEEFCRQAFKALADNGVLLYGDVFINYMREKEDPERVKDIIDISAYKAMYYLKHVCFEKAVFEMEHVPYILKGEREMHVTSDFWEEKLLAAGFKKVEVFQPAKDMPSDKVIVASKK